jgi:hypothetical protein
MADPMSRPMPSPGGASPMGRNPMASPGGASPADRAGRGAMQATESMLSPGDTMLRQSQGRGVTQSTTVREFLEGYGINVDGPVDQLKQMATGALQNANPAGRMQNMARRSGASPTGQSPMGQRPMGPSPTGQSPMAQRPAGMGATPGRAAQPAPRDLSSLLRR